MKKKLIVILLFASGLCYPINEISERCLMDEEAEFEMPEQVDFSFTGSILGSQSLFDLRGRMLGRVDFTMDHDSEEGMIVFCDAFLERRSDGNSEQWEMIDSSTIFYLARGSAGDTLTVPFGFDLLSDYSNGEYRVRLAFPENGINYTDPNLENNETISESRMINSSSRRIDSRLVDFQFARGFNTKVTTQEKLDKDGKFEGEMRLYPKQDNDLFKKVLVKYNLERRIAVATNEDEEDEWEVLALSFDEVKVSKEGFDLEKAKYKFDITTRMPNGDYRVRAQITEESQFHIDRYFGNNENFSPIRVVSDATKRKKDKGDIIFKTADDIINQEPFIVSPNPASDMLQIDISNELKGAGAISIYDIQGAVIMTKEINSPGSTTIDTSTLINGLYFVHYMNEEGIFKMSKIIIQH